MKGIIVFQGSPDALSWTLLARTTQMPAGQNTPMRRYAWLDCRTRVAHW
jgi:hypothetical protein